jgi:hypothetical protein
MSTAPQASSNKTLYIILGIVAALLVVCTGLAGCGGVFFFYAYKKGQRASPDFADFKDIGGAGKVIEAELAAESFLDDLKTGDFNGANNRSSRGLQSRKGVAGLRTLVQQNPILGNFSSRDTDTKRRSGSKVTLEATFIEQSGRTIKGTIDMVQESGEWKVDNLTIP